MTGPSRLAVHVGTEVPAALVAVVAAVAPRAEPVAASAREPLPERTRAHLYCSDVLPRRPAAPYAVWRLPGADADFGDVPVLGDAGSDGAPAGELRVHLAPWPDRARPILPFTRAGYRRLRGLPEHLVGEARAGDVAWGPPGGPRTGAAAGTWPTLAALSAAVIATGEQLWTALAWAAPAVTDPETARRLALVPGEHVLVGEDPAARHRLAAGLAADEIRAAALSRSGWQAARARRPEAVADELCRRLGIAARPRSPVSGLTSALDDLGTPPGSLVRRRARVALADLPGAVTSGWRPDREEHP